MSKPRRKHHSFIHYWTGGWAPSLQSGNQDADRNLGDDYLPNYGSQLRRFLKRLAIGIVSGVVIGLFVGFIFVGLTCEVSANLPMVLVFGALGGITAVIAVWGHEAGRLR